MKKILTIGIIAASILACSKKENHNGNVYLTGNIDGLSQGKLYIQKIQDTTVVVLDSIVFNGDSNFESSFNLDEPEVIYLSLDRGQTNSIDNTIPIFAELGEITITTKLKEFYKAAQIKGSKNHELWEDFKKNNSRFTDIKMELIQKEIENQTKFSTERQDSINTAFENMLKRKYLYVVNFAKNHADHEISPYVTLTEIPDVNVIFLDTIANKMTPKISKSKYGKLLKEHISEIKNTTK